MHYFCMAVRDSRGYQQASHFWAGLEQADGHKEAGPAKRRRTEEEKVERLRRTIFVGNLPVKVKAKLIKQAFSQ